MGYGGAESLFRYRIRYDAQTLHSQAVHKLKLLNLYYTALERLSASLENLQAVDHQNTCPSLFPRIVANIQLLLLYVELESGK